MKSWGKQKVSIVLLIFALVIGMFVFLKPNLIIAKGSTEDNPDSLIQKRLAKGIVLYTGSSLALVDNVKAQVDLHNAEVVPFVREGRVLVPIRFVADNLGAGIVWDEKTSAVTLTVGKKAVAFVPGNSKIKINGKELKIDTPAEIVNGRTFVPIRVISEAFGKKVFYDRGLIIIGEEENPFNKTTEKSQLDTVIAKVNNLPTVDSYDNLKNLLANVNMNYGYYPERGINGVILPEAMEPSMKSSMQNMEKAKSDSAAGAADYSKTNVQVEGVDEADIVKTDGEYIYQVNKQRVIIFKAYPAEQMEVVTTLTFNEGNYTPREIYLDDKYLVVIGSKNLNYVMNGKEETAVWPPRQNQDEVKVYIYDIRDKNKITKLREVEVEGYYLSSRKIGPYLYFVTNCPTYIYHNEQGDYLAPIYRDTVIKDDFLTVPYQDIRYFCPVSTANYLVIAGLNLESQNEGVQVSTYLGAGENLYVSQENLYIALEKYAPVRIMTNNLVKERVLPSDNVKYTTVYKFSLDQGRVTYLSKGEVPGTLLNQFSMDEYQDYLRIATTKGNTWGMGENMSQNNVYVLDESMNPAGKIENIAPGEKIYSARFMGERAYLVTFKNTDPFFVLDLKQPTNPRILGALKIPGYSDYLHPYDENHIIGFGKDTIEIVDKNSRRGTAESRAYYQGMKIALFDVTDVNNPREMFKEVIGDRGTDSELLRNHKALLFDREKELLAFPVKVMETQAGTEGNNSLQYGQFTFQGAYIYQLNLKDGFSLRGKISHLTSDDYLKAGYHHFNTEKEIKRIMFIKDVLYTLSDQLVKAHELTQLEERKELILP